MTDILERLRETRTGKTTSPDWPYGLLLDAADEIEQLRGALQLIADGPRDVDKSYISLLHEIQSEARKALGEKE